MSTKTTCTQLRVRFDWAEQPGKLGIVCNETTLWVHHIGVKDFVRDLVTWTDYIEKHPDYPTLPSSTSFKSCVTSVEGYYPRETIFEFTSEAVRSALPVVLAAWRLFNLGDPRRAVETEFIVSNLAQEAMAEVGDHTITANHVALALLRFGRAIRDSLPTMPEGLNWTGALGQAEALGQALADVGLRERALEESLLECLNKGESYSLPNNLLVLFDTDTQALYARLHKLTGPREPTAVDFWVSLIAEPSSELASAFRARNVSPEELRLSAHRAIGNQFVQYVRGERWKFWKRDT